MRHYRAVLFDLDGVLTDTAALHAACWKRTFDAVLADPFDARGDYLAHVDGKPREDGVRDMLRARGVEPDDATVRDIADRKQALVDRALERDGVTAFPGAVAWVRSRGRAGLGPPVGCDRANCGGVLRAAGIDGLFDTVVDGGDVARLGLRGKPAPDGFLAAARRLRVPPRRAAVVEDAVAGVAAGRAGGFGLVIGVERGAGRDALHAAGAHLVVDDLQELAP